MYAIFRAEIRIIDAAKKISIQQQLFENAAAHSHVRALDGKFEPRYFDDVGDDDDPHGHHTNRALESCM